MSQWPMGEEPPQIILRSKLWPRLAAREEYAVALHGIRETAAALAEKISGVLPEYTDHSVRHMDALWGVSDQILTVSEASRFSPSEAFLLASSFYVHDLGMALPVTEKGKQKIKLTDAYRIAMARFTRLSPPGEDKAEELALRETTRELHAKKALELATQQIPGLNRYLIEDTKFRSLWGNLIGTISESHHWTLTEVERSLGSRGAAPSPDGDVMDVAYVACVLRIVDFAHINWARAPQLERLLRRELPRQSELHWNAQAAVTGPLREADTLVFGCTEPITDTEAWWLFHDLAVALDAEIKGVYDYLRNRIKLILEGVGRRGQLIEKAATGELGTAVRIALKNPTEDLFKNLEEVVRSRAPMLSIPIAVNVTEGRSSSTTMIEPGWWKSATEKELEEFLIKWPLVAKVGSAPPATQLDRYKDEYHYESYLYRNRQEAGGLDGWPASRPQYVTEAERVISSGGTSVRAVLRCSRGIAVDRLRTGDLFGIVDVGAIDLNVSRESITPSENERGGIGQIDERTRGKLTSDIRPVVIEKTNELESYAMLPGRLGFLRYLAECYGEDLLHKIGLPWIPIIEPPGNLIHRGKAQLVNQLRHESAVIVAAGAFLGEVYNLASPHIAPSELSKLIVLATATRQKEIDVDYSHKQSLDHEDAGNPLTGEAETILHRAGCDDSKLVLTGFFVTCVAEAWGTTKEELYRQNWSLNYKEEVLWAKLVRS